MTIKRALISVSDKSALVDFAKQLTHLNIEILATGGTAKTLTEHQIPITDVSDYTGFPEMMDGRVKTLHPKIHAGILARRGVDDSVLEQHQFGMIDLVVVNLYPFQATIAKDDCTLAQAIEKIDIGGPTLLRAAAKNHEHVSVVVDPSDYTKVIEEICDSKNTTLATRRYLAQKTFTHTAGYDAAIAHYLEKKITHERLPTYYQTQFQKSLSLRYGENPHQSAAFYRENINAQPDGTIGNAKLLQGKPLSYNNMIDADAATACAQGLDNTKPGCVIVKHATPCGVAQAATLIEAYQKALSTDPTSAFGGIIAFNQPIDAKTAEGIIAQQFVEVIIAPRVETAAADILSRKKNCRVLECGVFTAQEHHYLRSVSGGLLIQDRDLLIDDINNYQVVTKRKPTPTEMQELLFAWRVVQFVKSNAIVYTHNEMTLGIGSGQTSRVFSAEIAILKAKSANLSLEGASMASDAFFPFADGVEVAAKAGIKSVIQPGGSKRDLEIIAAADTLDLTMVMTGSRHFLH